MKQDSPRSPKVPALPEPANAGAAEAQLAHGPRLRVANRCDVRRGTSRFRGSTGKELAACRSGTAEASAADSDLTESSCPSAFFVFSADCSKPVVKSNLLGPHALRS